MDHDPINTAYFAGGRALTGFDGTIDTGLDTPFDYPTCFALRSVFAGKASMLQLERALGSDWLYPHPERLVPFIDNHDVSRLVSESGATLSTLKLAVGVLATLRGMPELYSGDEIAMQGGEDPDNRRDFPGGFPGDPANAFVASGRTPMQQEVFAWTSELLAFRAHHPLLQAGQLQTIYADDTAIAYLRTPSSEGCNTTNSGERYLVVVNNAEMPRHFNLQTEATALAGCTQWSGALFATDAPQMAGSRAAFTLGAKQLAIYRVAGSAQPKSDASTDRK